MASLLNWSAIEPIVKEYAPECSDYADLARRVSRQLKEPLNRRTLWDWANRKLNPPPTSYNDFVAKLCGVQSEQTLIVGAERASEPPSPSESQFPRVFLKAAVFDLECMDLNAVGYQGYVVCGCILPLDSDEIETYTIAYEDHGDDKRLIAEFLGGLSDYDVIIGHNIAAFDVNYLHTRAMTHSIIWPRTWLQFDTFQVAKTLAIRSYKGLASLCDTFGIPFVKTRVYPRAWHRVREYDRDAFNAAMDEISWHCQQDVQSNRALFDALFPSAMMLGANPFKLSKFRAGA